jgi:hypothetical protein
MALQETPRFKFPYPGSTAESWWEVFQDFATSIDTAMLGGLEANAWTFVALPEATIEAVGGGYQLRLLGPCIALSRTYQTQVAIGYASPLALVPGWVVGVRVVSGARAAATTALELRQNGVPIEADYRVLGYVRADCSIAWWNASVLAPGETRPLFAFAGGGGGEVSVRRPAVLAIVAPTVAPPVGPTVGDRYILDYAAAPVHAGWGVGALVNDIAEWSGTAWLLEHAVEGRAAYVRADLLDAVFLNDPVLLHWCWKLQRGGGSLQEAYDLGNEIVIPDGGAPVTVTNDDATGHAFQLGGTGTRDVYSDGVLAVTAGTTLDVDATGALGVTSEADVTISAGTTLDLTADGAIGVTAGGALALKAYDELTLEDGRYTGGFGPVTTLPMTNTGVLDFIFSCSSLIDAINKAYIGAGSICWSGVTGSATPTEIFLGGVPTTRYALTGNSVTSFALTAVAREAITNKTKVWEIRAVATRTLTGVSSWVRVTPTYTVIDQTDSSGGTADWDIALAINDGDDTMRVTVTGQAGLAIGWAVYNK